MSVFDCTAEGGDLHYQYYTLPTTVAVQHIVSLKGKQHRQTPLTPAKDCLPSYPLGDTTGISVLGLPAGSGTWSSPRVSPFWTLHRGDSIFISTAYCLFKYNLYTYVHTLHFTTFLYFTTIWSLQYTEHWTGFTLEGKSQSTELLMTSESTDVKFLCLFV